jgi:hypothetical protein
MTNARRTTSPGWILSLAAVAVVPAIAFAQQQQADSASKPYVTPPMFLSDQPLEFTLHAPFSKLRRDRQEATEYRQAYITYRTADGEKRVPLRLRTRGVWRKANCEIPPLMFNFTKDSTKGTEFARADRMRFSFHCRDIDDFEQYVLQEYNLYRVQRLLTPLTFGTRLAKVTFVDSEKHDTLSTRYTFLQELDEEFAGRLGVRLVVEKGAGPADLDPYESAFFGVFQYFVANTDYSIRELHNVVLTFRGGQYVPVARDFDWSGAVNARYAKPNPILKLRVVTQRMMRGYCAPAEEYQKVFALFNAKKDSIYALYRDPVGANLKPDVVQRTLKYFDEFYATINDPRKAQREIIDACLGGSA